MVKDACGQLLFSRVFYFGIPCELYFIICILYSRANHNFAANQYEFTKGFPIPRQCPYFNVFGGNIYRDNNDNEILSLCALIKELRQLKCFKRLYILSCHLIDDTVYEEWQLKHINVGENLIYSLQLQKGNWILGKKLR